MPGSWEGQYIRLELIRVNDLPLPSERIPAGFYVSINVDDSKKRWKSAVRVVSSDESEVLGDTVILSLRDVPQLSLEIRVSYEVDRMLGNGEVVAKFKTSWDELLDRGDEPFDISFLPICDVHPSLTLKAAVIRPCDKQDSAVFDSIVECEIARETDAGHERFATYVTSKTVSHLNDAVRHFQLVLDQCPVDHPDRAAAVTNLACTRLKGYIRKDLQDIDSIISLFREALALRPQGHPDHPLYLYHLTVVLNWCYSKDTTAAYIHESAQLCCKLLPLCPEGTYIRSVVADGVNYVIRKCNKLPMDASDEGVHIRRVVLELCPLGNEHRPKALEKLVWALSEFATAVRSRFEQRGSIDDLDECIQCCREAVSLCPEGHSHRDTYLVNLAHSLLSRFHHQCNFHDLNEAISLFQEALRLRPVGHESRDSSLSHLGRALLSRFTHCGDVNDITRAVSFQREALTLCPPGHPNRDWVLNQLAIALDSRYNKLDVSEDLDESIDLLRDSLQLRQRGHPRHHHALINLSSALCSRFTQTQKDEDVEEAIRLCHESLEIFPSLHPHRFFSYQHLQRAHLLRYVVQHLSADMSFAVENFRLASRHPTHGFPDRIWRAIVWVRSSELYQHESALEAYQTCLDLFDNHVMMRSTIISRREAAAAFDGAQSLPVDAASCAINWDDPRQAIELLEQGRGQQWSLASRLRTPLEDLESENPNLAHKFLKLSKCLSEDQGSTISADRAAADQAETQYRKLMERWTAVVVEIRNLKSFSRFLLPPLYTELQAAARHGPVIILIASQYSCSVIIVPTSGDPHHVPLPSITLTDLKNLKDRFARAIRHASIMGPRVPRNDLIVLLRTVWDNIMLPIVNVLQHDLKLKHQSRIWLCPTAAFTSIPLHATHPFQTKADRSKEPCLEDLYICSYTPTLSALIRSRQMMKKRVPQSFVAIGQGQPRAGKSKELLAVDSEIELVRKLVPEMVNGNTISGDAATRAGALQALQENNWVHLACHGKQDREQPYNSHFVMKDEPITLLDIMEKDIPHAEFAFLSACHTAVGDEKTPDEVIHLAAGLQFSGFKSVVGTLWEVDDAVAKHVVKAFYENMFKDLEDGDVIDCTKAAWALNRATHAVKTKVPLEQRMVFIHVGV
ncbi:CHAT domain-containing protein [Suillus americanus]|nr:CHAT domain-containing protein [Suillus americanus]